MTQAALAEKVGTTTQNISQYERDIRNPKIETLKKIADALGVDISKLTNSVTYDSLLLEKNLRILSLNQLQALLDIYCTLRAESNTNEYDDAIKTVQAYIKRREYLNTLNEILERRKKAASESAPTSSD